MPRWFRESGAAYQHSFRKRRLYVLGPSHFCERARWALDHVRLAYTEVRWPVGLHVPLAKRLGARRSHTPILVIGPTVIQGSGRALDWTGLSGGDPGLERHFEERVGPLVRQYIYSATLHDARSGVREVLFDGVPGRERLVATVIGPITRRLMRVDMKTRPDLVPALEAEIEAELDRFEDRLGGREYLVGDGFGRADLTAASLLAPLARPDALPLYRRPCCRSRWKPH